MSVYDLPGRKDHERSIELAAMAVDFELTRAENLGQTFAQVAEELHHQYAIGFEPSKLDNRMHKIDVRVSEKGAKVRSRKEYFAKAPE